MSTVVYSWKIIGNPNKELESESLVSVQLSRGEEGWFA